MKETMVRCVLVGYLATDDYLIHTTPITFYVEISRVRLGIANGSHDTTRHKLGFLTYLYSFANLISHLLLDFCCFSRFAPVIGSRGQVQTFCDTFLFNV